jgi:hypothetical protein
MSNLEENSDGMTPFATKDGWGYIDDRTGAIAIKPRFKQVSFFSEGLAAGGVPVN